MVRRAYFVSDLHIFARRSEANHYLDAIRRRAFTADTFVLGGDIFDFRWSTLASIDETVEAACDWLGQLTSDCPDCHFHYLFGNHDYHAPFMRRLAVYAAGVENLCWHKFFLRMGDAVFLHGDVADRRGSTPVTLVDARSRWLHDDRRGPMRHRVYDMAIRAGLHRPLPYLIHRKRRVAKRILAYLELVGQGPTSGVRNIYFGHIHRRLSNYRYGGLTFHNCGASIKGQRLHILEAVIS
jgi:UDP-2,3-diacylglucosamine hydrolase